MERLRVIPFAVATAFLAATAPALAASGEDTPLNLGKDAANNGPANAGGGGSILRTLIGLAIVIGVIYGLHWILKQVKASKEGVAEGRGLSVVATLPVGGERSVKLVRAGEELVLIGIADQSMTVLRRYTNEEADELGILPVENAQQDGEAPALARAPGLGPLVGDLRLKIDRLKARTVIR